MRKLRCISFIFLLTRTALASEGNFAGWTGIILQGRFSDQWGYYLENQTRLNDGWEFPSTAPDAVKTRGNRFILRPAVRWLPEGDPRFQLFLGYMWNPNLSPSRDEHRLWQQVLYQNDGDAWWWAGRFRLEERWVEFTEGTAFRSRFFGRLHRYLSSDKKYGASLWEEVFVNLNSVVGGSRSGFDQNRLFLGPHFLPRPGVRLEAGYLNIYTARGSSRTDLFTHALAIYAYLDW